YAISNMNPSEFDFNPNYFVYPTFHIYLVLLTLKSLGVNLAPTASSILIGRLITVFFGVMSVYILYLLGRELQNEELGLISSTIFAITPLHVIHSHFLTTDVPVTFWILTSVLFSMKILNSGKTRWYILAGVTAGLGISTKYSFICYQPIYITRFF
ncbi:MAG: ArnT family glycosyltransferase, partial [Candidatus Hodarchaeales archaeon]